MSVVSKEIAQQEVQLWLESKGFKESYLEKKKDQIEELVECVVDGDISIDSKTMDIVQQLTTPIKGDVETTILKYKNKIQYDEIQKQLMGVNSKDMIGMLLAYGAAATGKPKAMLGKMDTRDAGVMNKIVIFFM